MHLSSGAISLVTALRMSVYFLRALFLSACITFCCYICVFMSSSFSRLSWYALLIGCFDMLDLSGEMMTELLYRWFSFFYSFDFFSFLPFVNSIFRVATVCSIWSTSERSVSSQKLMCRSFSWQAGDSPNKTTPSVITVPSA